MKRKALLAKALAFALAVSVVAPGAVNVNAAVIVTRTQVSGTETKDTWSPELGSVSVGGESYLHLQSSATNNNNQNSDYSLEVAPAVILDMERDMRQIEDQAISVDLYPNGTVANMRFGIMVKYVNATNWAYLNYDVGKWLLEYRYGDDTAYPTIEGLSAMANNENTNVKIEYTEEDTIKVTLTKEDSTVEEGTITVNALAQLDELAASSGAEVRFGFKAGTYSTNITDVNLRNMKVGDESLMDDKWDWVVGREGQVFEPQLVGGTEYAVVDAADGDVVSADTDVSDFTDGTVSAKIMPVSDNPAFALDARYSESGKVQVGYADGKWYYAVNGTKTQADGPQIAKDTLYEVSVTIDGSKLSAKVSTDAGETILADAVEAAGLADLAAGGAALEAKAGTVVYVKDVNYTKVVKTKPQALEDKYDAVKDTSNADNKYYSDGWSKFAAALDDAKAMIDSDDEITQAQANAMLTKLTSAFNGLELVNKSELQALYDEVKGTENKNYTTDSWKAFCDALDEAVRVLGAESLTKTEVTSAVNTLKKAVSGLVETPASEEEKQELTGYVDSVKGTVNNNYTAESWAAYQKALADADEVLAKGSKATQAEVKAALAALQKAFAELKADITIAFEKADYTVDATASVATVLKTNAPAVTYKTSDPAVATVDAKGTVTGVKAGKAVITATANGISAATNVTVTTPKVTLNTTSTVLQVKKSTKAIKVASCIATDSVVSWTSSNKNVATVSSKGVVKARKTGTTKLTVTMKSGASAVCKLKVQKGKVVTKSIKVAAAKVTLAAGEKYTINAVRNPVTATEKITYSSSKKSVATVSSKGVITAKKKGTSKITVKCNKKKKVITVTVK